jgi:phosphoribosylaminoimidazole (AIR) synthetase
VERKRTGYRLARKVIQEQAEDRDSEPEETQDPEEVLQEPTPISLGASAYVEQVSVSAGSEGEGGTYQ